MGFSIGKFFSAISDIVTGRPRDRTASFVHNGASIDFAAANDPKIESAAAPILYLAEGLKKADPSKLPKEDVARLHGDLKRFLDTWKARAPAEYTVQPTCWYTNTRTGEQKWLAPFEGRNDGVTPAKLQEAFTWLVNQAPQQLGFSDLQNYGKLDVQISRVATDGFDSGKGAKPDAMKVSIKFS